MTSAMTPATTYETILFAVEGGVARLRLNRPTKLNALSITMLSEIRQVLDGLQDGSARCLLITGEGRGFCSGADLTDSRAMSGNMSGNMSGTSPDLKKTLDAYYHPVVTALHRLPMPVITAVNGVCAGAGTGLALTGDLILAEVTTRFNLGFVNIGLLPDMGSTWSLPRRIGSTRAMEMALLGDEISGETALHWGLINRAVPEGSLQEAAQEMASRLAQGPTLAYALARKALGLSFENSLAEQLEVEGAAQRIAGQSEDFAAGVMGFLTKTPPEFKGR